MAYCRRPIMDVNYIYLGLRPSTYRLPMTIVRIKTRIEKFAPIFCLLHHSGKPHRHIESIHYGPPMAVVGIEIWVEWEIDKWLNALFLFIKPDWLLLIQQHRCGTSHGFISSILSFFVTQKFIADCTDACVHVLMYTYKN